MGNDRFKFRVFDKKNNEYVPEGERCDVHCLLWRDGTLNCGISYDDGYAGGIEWIETEDAIIEQCTGLKDKNGKLIYEGDVVRYYRSTAMCLGGERIAQVLWDARDAEFGILTTLGDGYNMREALRFGIEIIGNIHEMESEND